MNRRLALAVVLLGRAICAQNENASLTGEVTDASAAAVAHVSLRLVNNATGEVYQTISTDTGNFSFPLVKPGEYTLNAELTGFKQFQRTGIVLETGIPARANIRLEVGVRTEKVTVVAQVPLLESETSAVGATVANTTISDMPLVDRRATQLAKLSGFNVQLGTGSSTVFTIAGGRSGNGYFTMDGGNDTNIILGTNTIVMDPPLESVQEFNMSESNFSAELGRTGGGIIQLTTKSGTNSFYGSAYEYARNTAIATRSFFAPTIPILHYNLYGGALGGPIRKNKTFFFFNYEAIQDTTQTTSILNLPTPAEVSGNFSADSYVVRDPTTSARLPYPGNIIPKSAMDPIGLAVAQLYPAPNLPGRPSGNSNYSAPDTTTAPGWNIVSRIDHTISSKDRMFLRIAWEDYLTTNFPVFTAADADPYAYSYLQWYFNATATWIHTITPTALNEFRYTWITARPCSKPRETLRGWMGNWASRA